MMVCLCVSSPKNIPFNKEKPKNMLKDGSWFTCQMAFGCAGAHTVGALPF